MRKLFSFSFMALVAIMMTMSFSACSNNEPVADQVSVSDITLDRVAMALAEGNVATIKATVSPSDASDKTLTWTSSDESRVTVDKNTGVITAVSMGGSSITPTIITATANDGSGVKAQCIVGVNNLGMTFAIDRQTMTISPGTKAKINTIMESSSVQNVRWLSSDASVAKVEDGTVEGVGLGTATITVEATPSLESSRGAYKSEIANDNTVKLTCTVNVADALMSGKFSVSANKQVQFARSNLYWDGSQFRLEDNQTDYPTSWNAKHVSHFYWINTSDYQSGDVYYTPYAQNYHHGTLSLTDKLFCSEENPLTVEGQEDLYALSGGENGEWYYLLYNRTNADKLYKYGVTVTNNGKSYTNCLIIAPDDFSGTLQSSYTLDDVNAAGLVCLPSCGYRDNAEIRCYGTYGSYWTATADETDLGTSYAVVGYSSRVAAKYAFGNYFGYAIRLVHNL